MNPVDAYVAGFCSSAYPNASPVAPPPAGEALAAWREGMEAGRVAAPTQEAADRAALAEMGWAA